MKFRTRQFCINARAGAQPIAGIKAQLVRGGISAILVRVGSVIAGLVASVTLARLLGPDSFGVYAFVFSLITLLGLPVKMGLPTLILRETARADQAKDGALLRGIWQWSDLTMAVMASTVLSLSSLYLWLGTEIDTPRMAALLWALPLVPLIGWAEARGAALRGLRYVILGTSPDKIGRPLLLAAAVSIGSWISTKPLTATQAYAIHNGVAVLTLGAAIWILISVRPRHPGIEAPRTKPRPWIKAILPLSALAGLQVVSHNTDILMLGALGSDANVGLYRVAISGANMVLFGLTTVNLVLQPYFARAGAAGNHRHLQRLASAGARISVFSMLPVLIFFWVGGPELIALIFGDPYATSFWALIILCAGQSFSAFFGSVGNLLAMSGREWVILTGLTVSTLVNIALNWILIPRYGIEGAAIATGVSIMVWNLSLWGATWVIMRIDSSPLGLRRTPPIPYSQKTNL